MYLYFDKSGTLKEIINDIPSRVGNSDVNKIYAYYEGLTDNVISSAWIKYHLSDGSATAQYYYNNRYIGEAGLEIPYSKERDLKYFEYYKQYDFYEFDVPDLVLAQSGAVGATIDFVKQVATDQWVFNSTLAGTASITDSSFVFVSNNTTYTGMSVTTINQLTYGSTQVYTGNQTTSWSNVAYRTIEFSNDPSDTLLAYIKNNATNTVVNQIYSMGLTAFQVDGTTEEILADEYISIAQWNELKKLINSSVALYVKRTGDALMSGTFSPSADDSGYIGSSSKKWNSIYAYNVNATDINATSISSTNVKTDLIPQTTGTKDLGKSNFKWNYIYANNINSTNATFNKVNFSGASLEFVPFVEGDAIKVSGILETQDIVPETNGTENIGVSANRYNSIYANNINGNTVSDNIGAILGANNVVDNLTSTDTNKPLSANQGKELKTQVDARVKTADIVDNTTSTSTDKPLSANQGKALQEQIDTLKTIARYLSGWDCATGLATTNAPTSPYTYHTGDYFIITNVGTGTKYKPSGTTYTNGVASTSVETRTVNINDYYRFDGTTWQLEANTQPTATFSSLGGQPSDNTALNNALNGKVDKPSSIESGYAKSALIANSSEEEGTITSYGTLEIETNELVSLSGKGILTGDSLAGIIDDLDSGKQDTLTSGTNIKTVNSTSILGGGNIRTIHSVVITGTTNPISASDFAILEYDDSIIVYIDQENEQEIIYQKENEDESDNIKFIAVDKVNAKVKQLLIYGGSTHTITYSELAIPTTASQVNALPDSTTYVSTVNGNSGAITGIATSTDISNLQTQITNLQSLGRFLSIWNANLGTATDNPPTSPYTYNSGDYFRVGTSGTKMPNGSSYTIGGTNFIQTATTYNVGDVFYYTGTGWTYQIGSSEGLVQDVKVNGVSVVSSSIANVSVPSTNQMTYTTTAPTSDNTTGGLIGVILNSEPATKYNGYVYYIKGAGATPLTDSQVNGTSVVTNGVSNIVTNTAYDSTSNKIATMSDVPIGFEQCTFGTTTYAQITTIINNGKVPYVIKDNFLYIYAGNYSSIHAFVSGTSGEAKAVYCNSSNSWSVGNTQIPSSYVSSVNGSTGAITGVMKVNQDNVLTGNYTIRPDTNGNASLGATNYRFAQAYINNIYNNGTLFGNDVEKKGADGSYHPCACVSVSTTTDPEYQYGVRIYVSGTTLYITGEDAE